MATAECDGFAVFKFVEKVWKHVLAVPCTTCPDPNQTCSNKAPAEILMSEDLKKCYWEILPLIEKPEEGFYVAVPCRCR
jgi:hypothetical protein